MKTYCSETQTNKYMYMLSLCFALLNTMTLPRKSFADINQNMFPCRSVKIPDPCSAIS